MGIVTVLRSLLAAAAATLLGGVLLAAAPTASAHGDASAERSADHATQSERRAACNWRAHKCFGAISLNTRTGQVGWANDKRSKTRAVGAAQRNCKARSGADGFPGQCKRAGWVRNGCLATAVRVRNGSLVEWGTGLAYNEDPAKQKARNKVRGPGNVRIAFWICTSRTR